MTANDVTLVHNVGVSKEKNKESSKLFNKTKYFFLIEDFILALQILLDWILIIVKYI